MRRGRDESHAYTNKHKLLLHVDTSRTTNFKHSTRRLPISLNIHTECQPNKLWLMLQVAKTVSYQNAFQNARGTSGTNLLRQLVPATASNLAAKKRFTSSLGCL